MKISLKPMLLAAVALSMLLALLPVANAQQTTLKLDVTAPAGAIRPDVEVKQFTIKATYSFGSPAQSGVQATNANINVQIAFSGCPNGVTISGSPNILIPVTAGKADGSATATFAITATRDVPGLKSLACKVSAKVDAIGNAAAVPAASSPDQNIPFTVDYFPLIQAKVASKVQEAGPQKQIPFNVDLENKGNAQTQITFALSNADNGNWNPILPEVLVLDSFADPGGKTADTAIFSVATPFHNGWNNEEKAFQLTMTPTASADAAKAGNVLSANVLARVRGIYIPGFDPILMVGAVIGAALVARLARTEE